MEDREIERRGKQAGKGKGRMKKRENKDDK